MCVSVRLWALLWLHFLIDFHQNRTARPTCALCNKVMLVKRIYILNVVVKQEILIKTGKQNRQRIVVLHATEFHSLQKCHDKTAWYTTVTVWKLVTKKRMFCGLPHRDAATYSYPTIVNSDNAIIWYQTSRKQRRWCSNEEYKQTLQYAHAVSRSRP